MYVPLAVAASMGHSGLSKQTCRCTRGSFLAHSDAACRSSLVRVLTPFPQEALQGVQFDHSVSLQDDSSASSLLRSAQGGCEHFSFSASTTSRHLVRFSGFRSRRRRDLEPRPQDVLHSDQSLQSDVSHSSSPSSLKRGQDLLSNEE